MTDFVPSGAVEVDGEPVKKGAFVPQGAIEVDGKPIGGTVVGIGPRGRAIQRAGESARTEGEDRAIRSYRDRFNPQTGIGEYLWNEAKKTPAAIVGLAPDIVDWLGKKTLGQPTDFGNITRSFQRAIGANPDMKPPGPGTEMLGTVESNLIGSTPFALGAKLAGRGALGAATEMVSGLGGGVGEIVGREGGPVGGLAGSLFGSAAGFRAGNLIEKGVPLIKQAAGIVGSEANRQSALLQARGLVEGSPEFQAAMQKGMERAKAETVANLQKSFAQEDVAAVARAFDEYKQIQSTFPGVRNSVGEVTGNEPALALQAKLESKNIPALEERGARVRGNEAALLGQRENLVPQAAGGVKTVMRGARTSLDNELHELGAQASRYEGDLASVSERAAGAATPVAEAGAALKGASKEGYAASKGTADQKYQAFRASVGDDAPVDVSNVTDKLKELEAKFVFDKQPEVLGLISDVSKKPGRSTVNVNEAGWATEGKAAGMTVAQLDDLSSAANRDIQRLQSMQNPDRKAIAQLQAIKQEARTAIETTLEARGNTEALGKYREANRYFGEEHAPKYLTGVNLEVRLKNAVNEERIKPERVVSAYYKPNGTTEAQRFNTQFADNGPAKESLARGVFDLYKKEVIDASGGVIDPRKHDAFMRKYAAANAEYPWIASRLEKNKVAGEIAKRMEDKRSVMGEVAESNLAKAVGTKDPEMFMQFALSNKRELFNTLGRLSPEDRKNFAVAVLNRGWDEAGKGQIGKFLESEENLRLLLRSAFGKEKADQHITNLKLLSRGLEINSAAPKTSPMQALTEDSVKAATGTTGVQIFSALRSIGRRPGSEGWFLGVFGGQFVKAKIEAQADALLKQQLFDPDLLMATIQRSKLPEGMRSSFDATGRGKEVMSKMWDMTKAAVGEGAPTAAAIRLPSASREDR